MSDSPRLLELQKKFEDNPRRFFASLANEYRKAGDFQRAISICRIYLEMHPAHIAGHVVLGEALQGSGKTREAEDAFKAAIELDPENLIALRALGEIAEMKGNIQQAYDNFRKIVTADPRDHDTNNRLRDLEQALKSAATPEARDWIPPRVSSDLPAFQEVDDTDRLETGSVEGSSELPSAAEPAAVPAAIAAADEELATLLPESVSDHRPAIAEPVEQESAEDSLAVPDLLEEAGESVAPAFAADDFQYRTAEFSLQSAGVGGADVSPTSSDVESEAEALIKDVELPPAEPREAQPSDYSMRTGEYSLAQAAEVGIREPENEVTGEQEVEESARVEPAGPFITETVAELYLQQGFTGEALLVYRQLARAKPGDQRITARIATLEQRLADEHAARQAALDTGSDSQTQEEEVPVEPLRRSGSEPPEAEMFVRPQSPRTADPEEFDRGWDHPAPGALAAPDSDDWFGVPDVAPLRPRQTVQEFFAVLGRAKAEISLKPARARVSAADIRAAADITAGFGAFGRDSKTSAPRPISEATPGTSDPDADMRRFRSWLNGLSES